MNSFLQNLTSALTQAPQTAQDLESEVQNAKMYGMVSLALLAYIAFRVSK